MVGNQLWDVNLDCVMKVHGCVFFTFWQRAKDKIVAYLFTWVIRIAVVEGGKKISGVKVVEVGSGREKGRTETVRTINLFLVEFRILQLGSYSEWIGKLICDTARTQELKILAMFIV